MKSLPNQNRRVKTTLLYIITPIIALLAIYFIPKTFKQNQLPIIAISQFISHEAVNAAYDGLIDELGKNGFIDGKTVRIISYNAAGNMGTNAAIAQKIKGLNPKIVIALTTPSAQALISVPCPLVFSIVTDPVAAGLVKSLQKPGGHITGVTDMPPIEDQVKLIKQILPNAKVIAVPYSTGEANSVKQVAIIQEMAQKHRLQVQLLPITNSSQIQSAMARALNIGADAYLIPLDNTLVSAMPAVVSYANKLRIPVFTSESESVVKNHALANKGFNYYDIG